MSDLTSTEANVLRCGYDVGYFDKSDIAQWADRQIEACDVPSDALLDLSMKAAGYHGTLDNVDRELRGFIMPYANSLAERFPQLIPGGE